MRGLSPGKAVWAWWAVLQVATCIAACVPVDKKSKSNSRESEVETADAAQFPDATQLPDGGTNSIRDASVVDHTKASGDQISLTGHSCDSAHVRLRRLAAWPGNGIQIAIDLTDDKGRPLSEAEWPEVTVTGPKGEPLPSSVGPAVAGERLTVILFIPSDIAEEQAARVLAVEALVDGLPAGEKLALYLAQAGEFSLLADLSPRPGHFRKQLRQLEFKSASLPAQAKFSVVGSLLAEIEGGWASASRSVVVVGHEPLSPQRLPPGIDWLALSGMVDGLDGLRAAAGWHGSMTPEEAGAALAGYMADRRVGQRTIGVCPASDTTSLPELLLKVGEHSCAMSAPPARGLFPDMACDQRSAARDRYPFGSEIEIVQDTEQSEAWKANHANNSKDAMGMKVRLGGRVAMEATGSFRGGTSLKCARKSLSIDMKGPAARLVGGSSSDEFLLISMCKDEQFFRQVLANRIMHGLDLFDLEFRLVNLVRGGQSLGAYLLLEKPTHSINHGQLGVSAIFRRENDAQNEAPEIKLPATEAAYAAPLAKFYEMGTVAREGEASTLWNVLSERMDFDNYLRWMALNSYLENGDYVDEVYFYASQLMDGSLYFQMHGWDADDLQNACHHEGANAIADPHGMTYCQEANIDYAVVRSPEVYSRYIAHLSSLMQDFPVARVERIAREVIDDVLSVLPSDGACVAMFPSGESCADLRAHMEEGVDVFVPRLAAWRGHLEVSRTMWESGL